MRPAGKNERLLVREDLLCVGGGTDLLEQTTPSPFLPANA